MILEDTTKVALTGDCRIAARSTLLRAAVIIAMPLYVRAKDREHAKDLVREKLINAMFMR